MNTLVTRPTLTPRKLTAEPTESPETEPWKYMTTGVVRLKNLPLPSTTKPTMIRRTAPRTKAPISFGSAGLLIASVHVARARIGFAVLPGRRLAAFAPSEKLLHRRVVDLGQKLLRIPLGDHSFALRVEEHRVVADGENAGELVRDDDDRGAQAVA